MTVSLYPRRPARLLGKRRISALHSRARERMQRRARMTNILWAANDYAYRVRMPKARMYLTAMHNRSTMLYEQAKQLESWLWNHYPKCEMCDGTGRVLINGLDNECPKCEGQGVDRRG